MAFKARATTAALLGSTMLAPTAAMAQDVTTGAEAAQVATAQSQQAPGDEIIVTATRRAENLQDVPIAITAIGTKQLEDLQVNAFDDYARLVPSLSFKSAGPGSANVYFRGVASGENANHSASLPSVGTYLDEQPITTIQGALDVHVFDIARVEALAGPQGTLYGASSQAGTVRIITNKPDLSGTYGEANLELNSVAHGGIGYTGEAFINAPLSGNVAARVVGWYRHDAGYIDNVEGTLTFPINMYDETCDCLVDDPADDISFSNAALAEEDYNDVDTYGARAALKIDLDESWTVTPQLMGQVQKSNGSFAVESGLGDLETMQFNPERYDDKWMQGALTVEGKLGTFDVTYAGALLRRRAEGEFDYVDYAYFYDALSGYAAYFYDNDGAQVNPNQYVQSVDKFGKMSHELRFTSAADKPVRLVGGLFMQRQRHDILQNYIIDGIADSITVPGTESNIWLTNQRRVDRDYAVFGELSFDITPALTVTAGGRAYKYDNSLVGFFGYAEGYSGDKFDPDTGDFIRDGTGVAGCNGRPAIVPGSPCTNVDKRTKGNGILHRFNAQYKLSGDSMVYGTISRGYRPGGINRRGTLPPYSPDFIENYEIGGKFGFPDRLGHFNVAAYQLDWSDIQLSFLGANGLTEIRNAGNARIRGLEADLLLRPTTGLTLSAGGAFNNAKLRNDFCAIATADFNCTQPADNELLAPSGTRLPLTARFKGNASARYEWPAFNGGRAHVQGVLSYEGERTRDLRTDVNAIYGNMPGYAQVDLSAGVQFARWSLDVFAKNLTDKRGVVTSSFQCNEYTCGDPGGDTAIGGKQYRVVNRPRTIGVRVGTKF